MPDHLYNPKSALFAAYPAMKNLSKEHPDKGDMIPDSYYFAAAFLDTIGFFDRSRRFWTDRLLPDPEPIRKGMIAQLNRFNPDLTVVDDTLERLHAGVQPWSNAIL